MKLLCYLLCIIGATALIKIYNLHAARPLRNKRMLIAVVLLTMFLAWGGETPQADVEDVPQTDLTGGTARADVH